MYNRLTNVTGSAPLTVAYSNAGNISSKTGIGNYTYGTLPHAVTQVSNPQNTVSTADQTIAYNAFGKVSYISEGAASLQYTYDGNRERTIAKNYQNGILQKTTHYSGNYEKEIFGNNTRQLHYIAGGDGLAAIYVLNSGIDTMYYIHRDHLGSYDAITNQTGAVVQNYSFDAWGRRRNPSNWTYNNLPVHSLFSRGYTGHEMLDAFNLINMNGRVYDPMLGRFLSPDNYVQSPFNTQSYNRYSYCINNPLTYKDPSGDFFLVDDFIFGFFRGLFTGRNPIKEGWNTTVNCVKIYGGLFAVDTKQAGWFWQIPSRLFWQLPQTIAGLLASEGTNMIFHVNSVKYEAGATVLNGNVPWVAFTLGSYINGNNEIEANPNNWLFQHEYGHYLQSRATGWAYIPRYAIPSIMSDKNRHDYHEVEQDANARSLQYFHDREGSSFRWRFGHNPIGYPGTGWNENLAQFDTPEFQSLLQSLIVKPSFTDYFCWTIPVLWPILQGVENGSFSSYVNSESPPVYGRRVAP